MFSRLCAHTCTTSSLYWMSATSSLSFSFLSEGQIGLVVAPLDPLVHVKSSPSFLSSSSSSPFFIILLYYVYDPADIPLSLTEVYYSISLTNFNKNGRPGEISGIHWNIYVYIYIYIQEIEL